MSKKSKKGEAESKAKSTPEYGPPVLGVDIKGELLDVELEKVVDPIGPSDRMDRPGDAEAIEQLARSMRECGQLQPVMLERLADGRYCRVFGRRRIHAARKLNLTSIRAVVVPPLPDDVRRTVVAIENVQRQNLTPAEETLAVDELMQLQALPAARQFNLPLQQGCANLSGRIVTDELIANLPAKNRQDLGNDALGDPRVRRIASEMVAAMLGKTGEWVRDRLYIGRLSPAAKTLVRDGKLPLAHAREIAKLGDEKRRDELARDFAAGGDDAISDVEAGRLEDLQREVRRSVFSLNVVSWKLEAGQIAGKPPCVGCPHNSATSPGLFEGGGEVSLTMVAGRGSFETADAAEVKPEEVGVCTLPRCYEEKQRATKAAISACVKRAMDKAQPVAASKPPKWVDVKAIERKLAERRKNAKQSSSSGSKKEQRPKDEINWQARHEYHVALRDRIDLMQKNVCDKIRGNPNAIMLAALVRFIPAWGQATTYQESSRKKALKSPKIAQIVQWFKAPENVTPFKLLSEGDFKDNYELLDVQEGDELLELIAEAMGLPVPPVPKLEDFMPKKPEAKADAEKPVPGKKKAAKKAGKKAVRA